MASDGWLSQLPDELLLEIFSYLDIPDIALNIQYVNSHWRAIAEDQRFWKHYVLTVEEQMADEEIIHLLNNMPALRALKAERGTSNKLIDTLCEKCKHLKQLELHIDHKLTNVHLEKIAKHFPHIQHLRIPLSYRNSIDYTLFIQQFRRLISLRLTGRGHFSIDLCLKEIADNCPQLQEIDLGEHWFYSDDVILFLKAKKDTLTSFSYRDEITTEIIQCFGMCKNLKTLHFEHHNETLPNTSFLDLPHLKELGIHGYKHEHYTVFLRYLQKNITSNLLKLHLSRTRLTAEHFETLLTNCTQLKHLVLRNCWLNDGDDFQHIAKSVHLESLEVYSSNLSDAAVEKFSLKCKKLKRLEISSNYTITDSALGFIMNCKELQVLKFRNTRLTGQTFHLIPVHLKHLRELHAHCSEHCLALEHEHIKHLQEKMSQLKIFTDKEKAQVHEDFEHLMEPNIFS